LKGKRVSSKYPSMQSIKRSKSIKSLMKRDKMLVRERGTKSTKRKVANLSTESNSPNQLKTKRR